MTYNEWVEKYKPIQNPIVATEGKPEIFFPDLGAHLDFVQCQKRGVVWTLIEEEGAHIVPGYHTANRGGFYITEVAWNSMMAGGSIVVECEPEPSAKPKQEEALTVEEKCLAKVCYAGCPVCEFDDTEAEGWDVEYEEIGRVIRCPRCNAQWQEVFRFHHNEDMDGKLLKNQAQLWGAQ